MKQIRREIENSDSDWDREKLSERLAKLSGGVAVIKVGAATEVELKEKKHRIEDAIQATRAAVEEGIVPGGGVALLRAQAAIDKLRGGTDDVKAGRQLVKRALEAPLRQIAVNAGYEGGVVVEQVRNGEGGVGFNAATGRVRGPDGGRDHRSGQGDPFDAAERGFDRGPAHHHRGARRRGEGGRARRWPRPRRRRRHGRHDVTQRAFDSASRPKQRPSEGVSRSNRSRNPFAASVLLQCPPSAEPGETSHGCKCQAAFVVGVGCWWFQAVCSL